MGRHPVAWRLKWLIGAAALLAFPAQGAGTGAANVIDRAMAAHGGERLAGLTSVVTEWRFDDALIFQGRRPAPPWDRTRRWEGFAIDFEAHRYADARYDGGSGYEWITGTVSDSSGSLRLDYRNLTYRRTTLDFDDAMADAMLLSPLVLLRWLNEHRELAEYAGRRQVDDTAFEALTISRNDGSTIEAMFEADSGLIHGLDSEYTDYDGSRVPLRFRYLDWRNSHGLRYPARVEVRAHSYIARRASLLYFEANASIDEYLWVPDDFRTTAREGPAVRAFRFDEIADGVFFVGEGVMYQQIVEFDDFLVALDGSSGDVQSRIDAVRERIPDKPFRYVLASHHHDDHLHGLDEFAALGATILAAPAHEAIVNQYVEERLGRRPDLVPVLDKYIVEDGNRELHIIDIGPTPHSEHILVAHLPAEKILFAADLYVLGGRREPVKPAMANGLALFEQITRRNLDVELIVDPHSPLIASISDLKRSVEALRAVPEGIPARALTGLSAWQSVDGALARKDSPPETILVTGATGRQGGAVARELLRRGYTVRGLTRNPESPAARKLMKLGVELVRGDYDDAASLDAALDGADGIFAVTDFWEHGFDEEVSHGRQLVDAALRAKTPFFVFSSVASAHLDTGIPHFDSKWEIETYLRQSGLDHTVLRPVSFMENWSLEDEQVRAGRIVTAGDPTRPHQYISVRDIARFAADAFAAPERWSGRALDLAGDEISLARICEILAEITGHVVEPRRVSWAEYEESAGEEMTTMGRWFDEVGYSADIPALREKQPGMVTMPDYLRNLAR